MAVILFIASTFGAIPDSVMNVAGNRSMAGSTGTGNPWVHDIKTVTTIKLTTTGGTVWSAAERCCEFLEAEAELLGLCKPGVRVLELGAGCGMLGLTVARNLPDAAEVCLTEQAYGGALDHLRRNVAENSALYPNMCTVTCCACDWTHFMEPSLLKAAAEGSATASSADAHHAHDGHSEAANGETNNTSISTAPNQQHSPALHAAAIDDGDKALPNGTAVSQSGQQEQPPSSGAELSPLPSAQCAASPSSEELQSLHKLLTTKWDIIIGSDLVYNAAGATALPRVLATLMKPHQQQQCLKQHQHQQPQQQHLHSGDQLCQQHAFGSASSPRSSSTSPQLGQPGPTVPDDKCCSQAAGPVMYYAHTKHRYDTMDVLLFEQLEAEGLTVEEVVETGHAMPPPSPPPFSSLFPDMRCAVFKIFKEQCS